MRARSTSPPSSIPAVGSVGTPGRPPSSNPVDMQEADVEIITLDQISAIVSRYGSSVDCLLTYMPTEYTRDCSGESSRLY